MGQNETIENMRKRLIFRSGHRGTKEMDIILGSFATKNVPDFTVEDLHVYQELLNESDPDLYNWITRKEDVPADKNSHIMKLLLNSSFV
ncbi:MAG: succinate dehydrogenase assembly factor 2 [Micavibrio sp.]|nr:succinate dehydrogenase assembly factor 2 [Micavibrio sp.]